MPSLPLLRGGKIAETSPQERALWQREEMPSSVLNSIAAFMEENKVNYRWKKGIFALNNSPDAQPQSFPRSPNGTRKVYASMWGESTNLSLWWGQGCGDWCLYRGSCARFWLDGGRLAA